MPVLLLIPVLLGAHLFAAQPPGKPPRGASDAVIEQNIRARFAKSKIAADKFTVRVQGGVAILEGTTGVVQRKGTATRLAKNGGAVAVNNRIRITEEARQAAASRLAEHRKKPGAPAPQKAGPRTEPRTEAPKPAVSTTQAPTPIPPVAPAIRRAQLKH